MTILRRYLFLLVFIFSASAAFAEGYDHSLLDHFFKQYVDEAGQIDYAAAKQNRAELDEYLSRIKKTNMGFLNQIPDPEQMAFWLNVYHASLLHAILDHYPLKSTQEIPSFWERQFIRVGAAEDKIQLTEKEKNENDEAPRYSLSQIRKEILMPKFKDEKINLALAMGTQSGPLFPREVFTGPRVKGQLYKITRREANRSEIASIDQVNKVLYLSRVFEWHGRDFVKSFGHPEFRGKFNYVDTAVINFLIHYSKGLERARFLKKAGYRIEYSLFDWSLNDRSTAA